MANKNVELMRGEPEIAVRKLAIPIMISMLLTASYNIVDGIWVAGLGQAAIAGIGFVTPIFMILNGFSVGLGNGATSSISRAVGARNHEGASKSAIFNSIRSIDFDFTCHTGTVTQNLWCKWTIIS